MHLGVTIRNMGEQSAPVMMAACAESAERLGFESLWITDHIAIPPEDSEGSGGRYLETLTTLAWLAARTKNIKLGSGVLILPYRAALPTAKQIATVQELSGNRLVLGVGIGWMDAEFRALEIDRHKRGRSSDDTLSFILECFENEIVQVNNQEFIFKPRPQRPPILVGGRAPHALVRAAKYGDGWLPMTRKPQDIVKSLPMYRKLTSKLNKPDGEVTAMTGLPINDEQKCLDLIGQYKEAEVDRLVVGITYNEINQYLDQISLLSELASPGAEN